MLYRHTPAFQAVLQTALKIAAQERDYSDRRMIEQAKLACGKSTLNRFLTSSLVSDVKKLNVDQANCTIDRIAGSYLNSRDAQKLWDYLDNTLGLIEKAVALASIQKRSLYPLPEVANAMHCFYGVHKSSISKLATAGISGSFFCYKPSFRKEGFTVKSRMSIVDEKNHFFTIRELQRTSGKYEIDGIGLVEESEGFGLIKSDRLWLFLQDIETEQPRIFCLIPKFGRIATDESIATRGIKKSQIGSLHGYLLEGVKGNKNDAYKFNVVLIREDVEEKRWKENHPGDKFSPDDQIDIYPTGEEQRRQYAKELGKQQNAVPDDIAKYLAKGLDEENSAP
jgi:hypothetical protein